MQITTRGFYKLTSPFSNRGGRSIVQFPVGYVFEITQIDRVYNKVIGPDFDDWAYNNIPCELVEQATPAKGGEAIDARS